MVVVVVVVVVVVGESEGLRKEEERRAKAQVVSGRLTKGAYVVCGEWCMMRFNPNIPIEPTTLPHHTTTTCSHHHPRPHLQQPSPRYVRVRWLAFCPTGQAAPCI